MLLPEKKSLHIEIHDEDGGNNNFLGQAPLLVFFAIFILQTYGCWYLGHVSGICKTTWINCLILLNSWNWFDALSAKQNEVC